MAVRRTLEGKRREFYTRAGGSPCTKTGPTGPAAATRCEMTAKTGTFVWAGLWAGLGPDVNFRPTNRPRANREIGPFLARASPLGRLGRLGRFVGEERAAALELSPRGQAQAGSASPRCSESRPA